MCFLSHATAEGTEIPDSATTHMITTEEEFLNLTTLYTTPSTLTTASVSASAADEDLTSGVDAETISTTEQESLYPTTKGIRRIDDADLVSTLSTIDEMLSTEDELAKTTEKPTTTAPRITTRRPVFYPSRPIPGEGNILLNVSFIKLTCFKRLSSIYGITLLHIYYMKILKKSLGDFLYLQCIKNYSA